LCGDDAQDRVDWRIEIRGGPSNPCKHGKTYVKTMMMMNDDEWKEEIRYVGYGGGESRTG